MKHGLTFGYYLGKQSSFPHAADIILPLSAVLASPHVSSAIVPVTDLSYLWSCETAPEYSGIGASNGVRWGRYRFLSLSMARCGLDLFCAACQSGGPFNDHAALSPNKLRYIERCTSDMTRGRGSRSIFSGPRHSGGDGPMIFPSSECLGPLRVAGPLPRKVARNAIVSCTAFPSH